MTKTKFTLAALLLAAAAFSPAFAGPSNNCAACACPPAKKVVHRAVSRSRGDRAYAAAFYDYRSASAVGRSFRAPWVEAPHDGHVALQGGYDNDYQQDAGYAAGGDEYAGGYGGGYTGPEVVSGPDLNRGWSGGVGYMGGGDNGGGGGGGGTAIIAGGQNENGPTYNSYGQSFPGGGADTYAARANAYWRNTGIPIK